MQSFKIQIPDKKIEAELEQKINLKTKPIGALGKLESIAAKIGLIQQALSPKLTKPTIAIFAADHGIAEDGIVNPYPQEVTWQMVFNFLSGGAAINVFAKQNNINVKVVDAGVKHDFENHPGLIDYKIGLGTKNYLHEDAMSVLQMEECIQKGAELVAKINAEECNVIGFGEMGIGNTSAASLLMSKLTNTPIEDCVGKGTGLDKEGVQKKIDTLRQVLEKYPNVNTPEEVLTTFGGFEIAMMVGAMLKAAELKMILLVDGFIVTSALLVASKMYPAIMEYCIFCHTSEEKGHKKLLNELNVEPLLNLGMRLGEGTGAATAYPLVQSAVNFLNEMASFESAEVTNKD